MKTGIRILVCGIFLWVAAPTEAQPGQPWWSIGPKIGYTFGPDGGVTFGAEVSYFPTNDYNPFPYAFTFDINYWKDHFSIHSGIEAWFYIGADVGPTLFFSKKGVHIGISFIVWDGVVLYPYYEWGIPFDGEIFHGAGGYLKIPIGDPILVNTTTLPLPAKN